MEITNQKTSRWYLHLLTHHTGFPNFMILTSHRKFHIKLVSSKYKESNMKTVIVAIGFTIPWLRFLGFCYLIVSSENLSLLFKLSILVK